MGQQVSNREARKAIHRLRRKIEEEAEEINFLNIMPMMDMMTILLVFLIKQFSVQQLAMDTQAGLEAAAVDRAEDAAAGDQHHHY
jgi:biopolymer transport protein ExbD